MIGKGHATDMPRLWSSLERRLPMPTSRMKQKVASAQKAENSGAVNTHTCGRHASKLSSTEKLHVTTAPYTT